MVILFEMFSVGWSQSHGANDRAERDETLRWEASASLRLGSRIHQWTRSERLPILFHGWMHEGRKLQGRDSEIPLHFLRLTVMTGTILDSRKLQSQNGRIPALFVRASFRRHQFKRQQKCGNYLLLLAWESVHGSIPLSERHHTWRKGVSWRDLLLSVTGEENIQGRQETLGISKNKICIGVETDGTNVLILDEGGSKPSLGSTTRAFKAHIREGSILGDNSHKAQIEEFGLSSEVHPISKTKGVKDKDNPLGHSAMFMGWSSRSWSAITISTRMTFRTGWTLFLSFFRYPFRHGIPENRHVWAKLGAIRAFYRNNAIIRLPYVLGANIGFYFSIYKSFYFLLYPSIIY